MSKYSKFLIFFFLIETSVFLLSAQDIDSVHTTNIKVLATDSLSSDTSAQINTDKSFVDTIIPDTVFLINGDKITGNILSYETGRLKIDAQGPGIINIKWQKIFSVIGGNRKYKIENVSKEIFIGYINFSKDTSTIILLGSQTYPIKFPDITSIFPLESVKDSLLPAPSTKEKDKLPDMRIHSPDTVFLKNGDKFTGNILSFEQGRLKIDAQGPGIIYVKWHKIATISAGNRLFKVEDHGGEINIGYIRPSKDTGDILVMNSLPHEIVLEDVVRIFPLEPEWYRGFKGSMGGGLNYTKSSKVFNANVDYNLYYVISKWRFINNFSYLQTSTDKDDPSVKISLDFMALYALPHKWVLSEINSFNRNDELGIDSRISFGVGGGNNVVQTEKQQLLLLTGIVQNSERNIESNDVNSSFELPISLQHTIYSFIAPNLTSSTNIATFIGITEKGRYRFDASTDVTWEFVKNVKFKLSFYYNFDNQIIVGKNSQDDYGTVLSLSFDLK